VSSSIGTFKALSANFVGHEIAGGGKEERLGGQGALPAGGFVDADVGVLAEVADFLAVGPGSQEEADEGCFVGQDFALEPSVQRVAVGCVDGVRQAGRRVHYREVTSVVTGL
jgi:hypothetical protein